MKKMIIGGFLPLKNLPCHWFMEMACAIGGHYREVGQHMTCPSLASAVFLPDGVSNDTAMLAAAFASGQRCQLANP